MARASWMRAESSSLKTKKRSTPLGSVCAKTNKAEGEGPGAAGGDCAVAVAAYNPKIVAVIPRAKALLIYLPRLRYFLMQCTTPCLSAKGLKSPSRWTVKPSPSQIDFISASIGFKSAFGPWPNVGK